MSEPREPRSNGPEAVDVVAVLLIFAVIVFFSLVHVVLLPFVFSAVTAFVLAPLVDWLAKYAFRRKSWLRLRFSLSCWV